MEEDPHQESFLTVAEVAEMLKLNQQTVRNWIDQGSLPALRVGRRVRIKRSDFERVLERSYSAGSPPAHRAPEKASPAHIADHPERGDGQQAAIPAPSAEDFWGGTPVGVAEVGPDGVDSHEPPDSDEHGFGGRPAGGFP